MLLLESYMSDRSLASRVEGREKLAELADRLTPQYQPQFRSTTSKINFLRRAVLGFTWAFIRVTKVITCKYSFDGFVAALREQQQPSSEVFRAANGAHYRLQK